MSRSEVEDAGVEARIHHVVELRSEGVAQADRAEELVGRLELLELEQDLVIRRPLFREGELSRTRAYSA
jgi:hypothetical protein